MRLKKLKRKVQHEQVISKQGDAIHLGYKVSVIWGFLHLYSNGTRVSPIPLHSVIVVMLNLLLELAIHVQNVRMHI